MGDWNNIPRRITVNSFFIDKTEVANVHYREYLYWLTNVFGGAGMDSIVEEAKPDTLVWRSDPPELQRFTNQPRHHHDLLGRHAHVDRCVWEHFDSLDDWL